MYRLILLSLLIVFLAACMPAGYYSADPDMAVIEAQANLEKATVIAARTQEYVIESTRVAELDLAQRNQAAEKEIELIEARAAERREAVILQVTEQAVWSMVATASAAPMATQQAYQATQPVLQITQQALERQVRIDEAREKRTKAMTWVVPVATVLALTFLALKMGAFIDEKKDAFIRRNSIAESRSGTVVWDWDHYRYVLISEDALMRRLQATSDFAPIDAVEFSRNQITATSPVGNGNGDSRKLAIQLVQDAIASGNEDGNIIPSWRRLSGWNGRKWSEAVSWLKDQNAVKTVEQVGTYIKYESLADLLYALETNQPPAPRG